jgi:uncharacterized membrane protein
VAARSGLDVSRSGGPSLLVGCVVFVLGLLAGAEFAATIASQRSLASQFVSGPLWEWSLGVIGGQVLPLEAQPARDDLLAEVSSVRLLTAKTPGNVLVWLLGGLLIAWRTGTPIGASIARWGVALGLGGIIAFGWEVAWITSSASGFTGLASLLPAIPQFWCAIAIAFVATQFVSLCSLHQSRESLDVACLHPGRSSAWLWVIAGTIVYCACFIPMNWLLYFNLLVPHGDSVMYEEHLWNVLHGKGFRSYLDPGLFLGEHIQVIHLGLLPVYVFWPSHLLLEACESLALCAGAWPVYWMARRHSQSEAAAACLAIAYLCYFPMQFLDIAIDLKTFRPEAFGAPLLLLTLDQFDRGRFWRGVAWMLVTLLVKEDYALVVGPLGVWWAFRNSVEVWKPAHRQALWQGFLLSLGGVAYLLLATKVLIPAFRDGAEVHYAAYYRQFGTSFSEIMLTVITRPDKVLVALATVRTVLYAISLLVPLGGLPCLSAGRLAVGLPLFCALALNDLAPDPRHHFHAPLVAILFWAAAGGLGSLQPLATGSEGWRRFIPACRPAELATWGLACCMTTGLFFSLSPLGLTFWDFGSNWSWQKLYVPTVRSQAFATVERAIPVTAKVASTDFVHPRFTHYERSYDYSSFKRRVSNYEDRVPDDTEYIVIDTRHPYSTIKKPEDVRELKREPEKWDLLSVDLTGHYVVLKRK